MTFFVCNDVAEIIHLQHRCIESYSIVKMKHVKDFLHKNDLAYTSCREGIVQVIASSTIPLSEDEIKARVRGVFDRTTFYRTFKILITKGVLHKIVIDNTLVKYALNREQGTEKQHAHFYCLNCKKVFCLPQVKWEYSQLPDIYKPIETDLLIKGYCKNCK